MSTLMELMVKIGGDTSGLDKALGSVGGKVASAGKSIIGGMAKFSVAAVGAAAAGVASLTKSAVNAYANFQQLEGGVETLYGNAMKTVMNDAKEAYETAGLSMNEYMETVNGMAGALLQSLDSEEAAAEKANQVVIQMADNANKMGTSMESIQNAYAGFAKGNYTMLDNLKLGYGGTKEEMQRLLKKAQELKAQQGEMVEYSIDSYADIVDAIKVVQDEMGITGTTSEEAAKTISGSLAMLKSSWENLITTMGSGDAGEITASIDKLVESATVALRNLKPVILNSIKGIAQVITELAPEFAAELPGLMREILPPLTEALVQLLEAALPVLAELLPGMIQTLLPALIESFKALVHALVEAWPEIWAALKEAFGIVVDEISGALEEAFPGLGDMISEILQNLEKWAPVLLTLAGAWGTLKAAMAISDTISKITTGFGKMSETFGLIGTKLAAFGTWITGTAIPAIGSFLAAAAPVIGVIAAIAAAIAVVILVVKNWGAITEWLAGVWEGFCDFLTGLGDMIVEGWAAIGGEIKNIFLNIVEGIKGFFTGLLDKVKGVITSIGNFFKNLFNGIKNTINSVKTAFSNVWEAIKNGVSDFVDGVVTAITNFGQTIAQIWDNIWTGISDFFTGIWEGIVNFVTGIWDGICNKAKEVWEGLKNFFFGVLEGIANFFTGIWDGITGFLSGVWNGIKDTASEIWNNISTTISDVVDGLGTWLGDTWDTIKETAGKAWDSLKEKASEKWDLICNTAKDLVDGMKESIEKKWDEIKQKASEKWNKIKEAIGEKWQAFWDTAAEIGAALRDGLKSVIDKAADWGYEFCKNLYDGLMKGKTVVSAGADNIASTIASKHHHTHPDEGPMKDDYKWMPDYIDLLVSGIDSNISKVENASDRLAMALTPEISDISGDLGTVNIRKTYTAEDLGQDSKWSTLIIPMYLDGTVIDERVITAEQIHNYRAGGR